MDEPTSVFELLERAELGQYAAAFDKEGYDSLSQLHGITEEDLTELIADVNMKKGHVKRLLAALGREGSAGRASTGSAAATPAETRLRNARSDRMAAHPKHVPC